MSLSIFALLFALFGHPAHYQGAVHVKAPVMHPMDSGGSVPTAGAQPSDSGGSVPTVN